MRSMTATTEYPIISLADVRADVPSRPRLLVDVSLRVNPGDRIAVMGPSGSGKSTLLAIIGGLLEPTGGTRTAAGLESANSIAWILQQTYVLGYRTVAENVALAGIAIGQSASQSRKLSKSACQAVGLAEQSEVLASRVSGGERQRIAIARALVGSPLLILADEPTASLDADLVHLTTRLLLSEAAPTAAVIIASHDERVAASCDRIVRLERGRLVTC